MPTDVSEARLDDVDSIVSIQSECGLSEWTAAAYRDEIGRVGSITFAARSGASEVIGFIIGRIMPGEGGYGCAEAEIYNIGVRPSNQRSGVGTRLLLAFLADCEKAGVRTIWLDVRASNSSAITFYSRHGFAPAGTRAKFYSAPLEDAIIMVLRPRGKRLEQRSKGA